MIGTTVNIATITAISLVIRISISVKNISNVMRIITVETRSSTNIATRIVITRTRIVIVATRIMIVIASIMIVHTSSRTTPIRIPTISLI
jgi:hypothetical protein